MGAVEIAGALAASRRAVRLYPAEHPAHRAAVRDLVAQVGAAIDIRPLTLNLRDGRLYEGSEVITDSGPSVHALAVAMESRRVESLTLHMGFAESDAEAISEILSMRPSPELQVQLELEERGVGAVTVSELRDDTARESEARDQRREADRSLYRQTLSGLISITTALAEENPVDPIDATRAIAQLIERVGEDPPAAVALAMMTGHGERWRSHAVSVLLYSLVLGHAISLSDEQQMSLGLASLLHDVGSVVRLSQDDADTACGHPSRGAWILGSLLEDDCVAMIVACEHHSVVGSTETDPERVSHPFTRIVAVGDRYDNLIRPAEGAGLRPDDAAMQLLRETGDGSLDPILTRLFVQAIGAIPTGTVLRLSDFSIGVVRAPGLDPLRPQIRLVMGRDGSALFPVPDIDLTEDERTIVEIVPSAILELLPSDYI